jgi:energy-coupling factor transporter ATP-binding protein EcfA2
MKIEEIVINNYRAFCNQVGEEERYKITLSGGKNLLIYGENGSGKSSIFKALRDFFNSASNQSIPFPVNIFSEDLSLEEPPFVKISFTDGKDIQSFYFSSDFPKTSTNTGFLRSSGKAKSFMSYRELMKIHFINQKDVNLFEFLIEEDGLLSEILNPASSVPETKLIFSELWKKVTFDTDETVLQDFNNGLRLLLRDLSNYLNTFLLYFDGNIKATFEFNPISKDDALNKKGFIGLKVTYCEKEISQYHLFLNEARLTALAISIYLSAHLSVPASEYEILFLDDVFTGLDTSNRLPLLRILSAPKLTEASSDTFLNHQIFLTTYDRQWFDLARQHLGVDWKAIELFVEEMSDNIIRPILIDPAHDYLQKARSHFENKDYPACANYQRRECEKLIKKFLPDHYKYNLDSGGNIIATNSLGTLFDNLQKYCKENNLNISSLDDFKKYNKIVMNPLSHDDLESPAYRKELESVFKIIEELTKLENVLKLKAGITLYLMKENPQTRTKYQYEFELMENIRLISSGSEKTHSPITVLPVKMKVVKNESSKPYKYPLLNKILTKVIFLRKGEEILLQFKPDLIQKIYKSILKYTGNIITEDSLDNFYIEQNGDKKTLKEVIEN